MTANTHKHMYAQLVQRCTHTRTLAQKATSDPAAILEFANEQDSFCRHTHKLIQLF